MGNLHVSSQLEIERTLKSVLVEERVGNEIVVPGALSLKMKLKFSKRILVCCGLKVIVWLSGSCSYMKSALLFE